MVRRNPQQLVLALAGNDLILVPTPRAAIRVPRARAFAAGSTATATVTSANVGRVRTMPSRDSRGRFVSFPTTDAPSWYVFCADGYRILGQPLPDEIAPAAPTTRQPLPRAVARSRRTPRSRLIRADLLPYSLFVIAYIALLLYGLHLPRPNR